MCSLCSIKSFFFSTDLLLKAYLKCMNGWLSAFGRHDYSDSLDCWLKQLPFCCFIFFNFISTFSICWEREREEKTRQNLKCTQSASTVTFEFIQIPCKCQNISFTFFVLFKQKMLFWKGLIHTRTFFYSLFFSLHVTWKLYLVSLHEFNESASYHTEWIIKVNLQQYSWNVDFFFLLWFWTFNVWFRACTMYC